MGVDWLSLVGRPGDVVFKETTQRQRATWAEEMYT